MDEPQAPAQNEPIAQVVEENNQTASPAVEPTTSAPEVAPEPVAPQAEPEMRPAERKIRTQANEIKQLREQVNSLSTAQIQAPELQPLSKELEGRDSINPEDIDRLEQQRMAQLNKANDDRFRLLEVKANQERAFDNYEKDMEVVMKEVDEVGIKDLEDRIVEAWKQRAIKSNPANPSAIYVDPQVRLADVAKEYLEIARASMEHGRSQTLDSRNSIVDNAAILPSTESAPEVKFEDKSTREMEAELRAKGYDI